MRSGTDIRPINTPVPSEGARFRRYDALSWAWGQTMKRRDFIILLGWAVAALPRPVPAQQAERIRRVGLLLPASADDPEYPTLVDAFVAGLQQSGWKEGRNLQLDIRWSGGNVDVISKDAVELVALAPDVILAAGSTAAGPLIRATRTIPIVFTIVPDPVGAGFVESLARPGGNATGFASFEYDIGGKWLELLKELAPNVTRVAVLRDPLITAGIGQFGAIQSAAPSARVEVSPINMRDGSGIERDITAFAHSGNGGLIVTSSGMSVRHRDLITMLAARYKLPAVYYARSFATGGGLISYGSNRIDEFRRAAIYVDRILKGEKSGDLPVQTPTKYELVINLKTAKSLGLEMPPTLLARADEVIE
jgi:putative ABC transport system substrate-binding protein